MGSHRVADGTAIAYSELGSGPAVVLVSGFGLTRELWDRQVRELAPSCRVVCVEQRGHGESGKPLTGYRIPELAQDLAAVLDALRVTSATVVGHSLGGQAAFALAARRPDLVAKLVLVGSNGVRASRSSAFPFGPSPESMARLVTSEQRDRIRSRRTTLAHGFHEPPTEDVLRWLLRESLKMPSWSAVACYRSMIEADLLAGLARVTMPVVQIVGRQDPVCDHEGAAWVSDRLADSRLELLADCGHYPMLESPSVVCALLAAVAVDLPNSELQSSETMRS